ncbi:MAG: hypothetical protein MRY74_13160 [Neomegalonema sp.]|nr:hypothetical protein [Neomegalonema sp.]
MVRTFRAFALALCAAALCGVTVGAAAQDQYSKLLDAKIYVLKMKDAGKPRPLTFVITDIPKGSRLSDDQENSHIFLLGHVVTFPDIRIPAGSSVKFDDVLGKFLDAATPEINGRVHVKTRSVPFAFDDYYKEFIDEDKRGRVSWKSIAEAFLIGGDVVYLNDRYDMKLYPKLGMSSEYNPALISTSKEGREYFRRSMMEAKRVYFYSTVKRGCYVYEPTRKETNFRWYLARFRQVSGKSKLEMGPSDISRSYIPVRFRYKGTKTGHAGTCVIPDHLDFRVAPEAVVVQAKLSGHTVWALRAFGGCFAYRVTTNRIFGKCKLTCDDAAPSSGFAGIIGVNKADFDAVMKARKLSCD